MSTTCEKLEWVPASGGECPENAIEAGTDSGCKVFIARAHHENGMIIPGKLHESHSCAYIPYNMEEVPVKEYEVLCGPPTCLSWVEASGGEVPEHAVPGGNETDGETLFIGRVVRDDGTVCVGKVHPSHKSCYIPYGGQELAFEEYEILVKNKLGRVLNV